MIDPIADLQKEVEELKARMAAEEAHTHPISRRWPKLRERVWAVTKFAAVNLVKYLPHVVSVIVLVYLARQQGCSLPIPPAPPAPVDSLTVSLQAAYAKDADLDRAKSLKFLQDIYPLMATAATSQPPATNAAAFAWMKSKVQAPGVGLTATQLVNLRKAIAAELTAAFGDEAATPMDAGKFHSELTKIGGALQGVK